MSNTIIISPSGAYYGSEQMLHEHLIHSKKKFKIYVKTPGSFYKKLKQSGLKHKLLPFNSEKLLYLKIFIQLLFGNYHSVYVNEGGHIKYIKLLAWLFKSKRFVVHVRLVEDTNKDRLGNTISPNIQLVCVSNFINNKILLNNPDINPTQVLTVHDYYISNDIKEPSQVKTEVIRIGILGRVSKAKGISKAKNLLQYWDKNIEQSVEFYFYGDVIEDEDVLSFKNAIKTFSSVKVFFKGFVSDKEAFFKTFDMVIHFNALEPFPRIYFDSMARLKPVLGFDSGGIGEQARIFGFEDILVKLDDDWSKNMSDKIIEVADNLYQHQIDIYNKRDLFKTKLKVETYINSIESYF
jgi:hypothetical protein